MCVGLCIAVEGFVCVCKAMYSRGGLYKAMVLCTARRGLYIALEGNECDRPNMIVT